MLKHNPRLQKQDLIWLSMELSDVKTIQDAVEELKKKESKVDILSKWLPLTMTSNC